MAVRTIPSEALSYTVEPSDTLYGLALKYNVSLERLLRANALNDDVIKPGQILEIPTGGAMEISVRPGDTLSALSFEFSVPMEEIIAANDLNNDALTIGMRLLIPPPVPKGFYRVRSGDNLTKIAARFETSPEKLALYNGIEGDSIRIGQLLAIQAPRPEGHTVKPGESLWSLSDKYGIPVADLALWNALPDKGTIHPGEILVLYPGIDPPSDAASITHVELAAVEAAATSLSEPKESVRSNAAFSDDLPPRCGEYYYSSPDKTFQPNISYWEESDSSVLEDYERGRKIYAAFRAEIAELPALGNELRGLHIVLDPGHGGLDPGAIVSVNDGNGNPVVVTEDEYAYDIALRLYRILTRHGASVSLTTLAPDHTIRNGINAQQTFVNKKNEVYNDRRHNAGPGWRPVGTADGLDMRKTVASRTIRRIPFEDKNKGTLFISLHADNSPDLPAGTAVLFDGETDEEAERSQALASALAAHMRSGSFIKRQHIRVLRSNPADAAVLVETRNVYYARNAWALRSAELREQDAGMIAKGVLAWAAAQ